MRMSSAGVYREEELAHSKTVSDSAFYALSAGVERTGRPLQAPGKGPRWAASHEERQPARRFVHNGEWQAARCFRQNGG